MDEIIAMDPDILCLIDGPGRLPDVRAWGQSPEGRKHSEHGATSRGTDELLQHHPANPRQALPPL